jgi:hypothetical protein
MPIISRFFGIVIFMNYNDHLPPHFHARYQDQEITVEIDSGVVTERMARRELRMVLEWSESHQQSCWIIGRWRELTGPPLN